MDAHLRINVTRDGLACTLTLRGDVDLCGSGELVNQAARAVDERTEELVLDLAGVTFLDCAGVRALAIATCFAPAGCPVFIRSPSPPARRIIDLLGVADIENLRRLGAGRDPAAGVVLA